jgi:hypothetical protein
MNCDQVQVTSDSADDSVHPAAQKLAVQLKAVKMRADAEENFTRAAAASTALKTVISSGRALKTAEDDKAAAIMREDYEAAKALKIRAEQLRAAVTAAFNSVGSELQLPAPALRQTTPAQQLQPQNSFHDESVDAANGHALGDADENSAVEHAGGSTSHRSHSQAAAAPSATAIVPSLHIESPAGSTAGDVSRSFDDGTPIRPKIGAGGGVAMAGSSPTPGQMYSAALNDSIRNTGDYELAKEMHDLFGLNVVENLLAGGRSGLETGLFDVSMGMRALTSGMDRVLANRLWVLCLELLNRYLGDRRPSVVFECLHLLFMAVEVLGSALGAELKRGHSVALQKICQALANICSENNSRMRVAGEGAILFLATHVHAGPALVLPAIMSPIDRGRPVAVVSVRIALCRLHLLWMMIDEFGVGEKDSPINLMDVGVLLSEMMRHTQQQVRGAAVELTSYIYKAFVKDRIIGVLHDVPANMKVSCSSGCHLRAQSQNHTKLQLS